MGLFKASIIAAGVFAAFVCYASAEQQQPARPTRIGIMVNGGPGPAVDGLRRDFAKLGYVENQTAVFEARYARGDLSRHKELAADLVRQEMDVIVTLGGPASRAAKDATATIPIVFSIVTDPVALGLAVAMERPGGNATGVTNLDPDQARLQFELLKELLPKLTRVAILSDAGIPGADASGLAPIDRGNDAAARSLGLTPHIIKIEGPAPDFDAVFGAVAREGAEALMVLEVPVALSHRNRIAEMAAARRLPTVFPGGTGDAGGLIAFGTTVADTWPRLPVIADKVLRGAKPGEIPIEVISRRELVLNLKTGKAIGVEIPAELKARATRLID